MDQLKKILFDEIKDLNEAGHKFINGELSRADFKKISGGYGVYAQREAEKLMVRLRTPSGICSKENLVRIYEIAKNNNLEKIHLTTRQAIQLHDLNIDQICEVIKVALEHNIYTRGAGGDFPRNIALSPLSGVAEDEVFDVTPYAIRANEHFMNKINTYKLPRKFKVSFSNNNEDNAHCTISDLGFIAVNEDGKKFFKVYIGGGLGKNPSFSVEFDELVEPQHILYHIEALTNLFMAEGDYENRGKARIRYIVQRLGEKEFLNLYKKYLEIEKQKGIWDIDVVEKVYKKTGIKIDLMHPRLYPQKQSGLYSVYFHPTGGQLKLSTLELLLKEMDKILEAEVRLTMTEGMFLRNLNGEEAIKMLNLTKDLGGETRLQHSVSCIGVPTCQVGVLNSQQTLREVIEFFKDKNLLEDILPSIHISGCPNSCGVHQISSLGFTGKMKRVGEDLVKVFEFHGKGSNKVSKTNLAHYYGDIPQDKVPEFLFEMALAIKSSNLDFEQWFTDKNEELTILLDKYIC